MSLIPNPFEIFISDEGVSDAAAEVVNPATFAFEVRLPKIEESVQNVSAAVDEIEAAYPAMMRIAEEFADAFNAIGYNYVHVDPVVQLTQSDELMVVPESLAEFQQILRGNDRLHKEFKENSASKDKDVQTAMTNAVEPKSGKSKSVDELLAIALKAAEKTSIDARRFNDEGSVDKVAHLASSK